VGRCAAAQNAAERATARILTGRQTSIELQILFHNWLIGARRPSGKPNRRGALAIERLWENRLPCLRREPVLTRHTKARLVVLPPEKSSFNQKSSTAMSDDLNMDRIDQEIRINELREPAKEAAVGEVQR
jgi:hypothetical protein